jgi:hypothetical protein
VAYYPLWRAESADGTSLPTRRGADGELEIGLAGGQTLVTLRYVPGAAEWLGVAVTAATLVTGLALVARAYFTAAAPMSEQS